MSQKQIVRLNAAYGRPVIHIAPRTGDRCFKETGAGLLKAIITNTFYLMIILVSGDSLDIKELTCAIIINFILYFHVFMCIRRTGPRQRSAYSLKVLLCID